MDFIFLDIETTCWENDKDISNREIIEFGIVLFQIKNKSYHQIQKYVKPLKNSILSEYCKTLTNIDQSQINKSPEFCDILFDIKDSIETITNKELKNIPYFTWGEIDKQIILQECNNNQIQNPFGTFYNLKCLYSKYSGELMSLKNAIKHAGLSFQGQHHSAIDDAMNLMFLFDYLSKACPYHLPNKVGELINV